MNKRSLRGNSLLITTALCSALAASALWSSSAMAQNGFALQGNTLTITGGDAGSTFSQTAAIDTAGVVSHVTDVPSTNDIGMPNFAFTLVNHGMAAGTYEFSIGVIFDRDGNQSRMEARLTRLILNVAADGTVTGSIPSASNQLKVIGVPGNGSFTLEITIASVASNGPVRISGGTVSFNASELIDRIRTSHASFNDIILEEFDETASYSYRIVVDQTTGSPAQFSRQITTAPATYAPLPKVQTTCGAGACLTSTAAFQLDSSEFAPFFADAYTVSGTFNSVPYVPPATGGGGSTGGGSTGGGATGGGGGVGGTTTPALPAGFQDGLNSITTLLGQLTFDSNTAPTSGQLATLEQALGSAQQQLETAQQQIQAGTLTIAGGFSLLTTSGQTFDKGGVAAGTGASINVDSAADTMGGFADVIAGMVTKGGLTSAQVDSIATFTETRFQSAAQMITATTSVADIEKMMDSTAELLNNTLNSGAALSPALVTAAVQIALKAVSTISGDVATKLGLGTGFDINNATAVQNLLRNEPVALSSTLEVSPAITSRQPVDSAAAKANLVSNSGINAAAADRIVAALGAITNPAGVQVGSESATSKLLTALARAFGGGNVAAVLQAGLNAQFATDIAVDVDAVTGALRVRAGAETFAATSTAVRLVPNTIPEGVNYLADGRAVAVADGVAVELAPAAADILGFAAAAEKAGFPASFRANGSIALALANNQRFSGTFAFDPLGTATSACGTISFSNPTGLVNAESYAFTMSCANGIRQRILPFIDNDGFFNAVANAGMTVRASRSNGIITIGTVGRFKPSFFVTPLTSSDQTYLTQNGRNGFAFRSRDANADGRTDFDVISATGVQVLYGAP